MTRSRKDIAAKTKGHCAYCGYKLPQDWHIDHIIPKSVGGADKTENMIAACPRCNMKKYTRTPEQYKQRLVNDLWAVIDVLTDEVLGIHKALPYAMGRDLFDALMELRHVVVNLDDYDLWFPFEREDFDNA